jgi:hypothetical protein
VGLPKGESGFVASVVDAGPLVIGGYAAASPRVSSKSVAAARIPLSEAPFDAAYRARFGVATSDDYRSTFFSEYPELQGNVVVHHAVEQQALRLYPNTVTSTEIHSLENLRGIPLKLNSELHQSIIRAKWNKFYLENPNASRQQLLQKATQIDFKYGKQFTPPVGRLQQ